MGKIVTQYVCTGFGQTCNYVLECSSEYTVGALQSSTKGSELNVYKLVIFNTNIAMY